MRPPASVICATPVVPTTSSAPGIWTLEQALQAQAQGIWPSIKGATLDFTDLDNAILIVEL